MFESVLGGAGLSSAQGLLSGAVQNSYNKKAASRQNAWNVENYKNRHQWEIEDLKKAGLNPILSALGGGGGGSVASASAPTSAVAAGKTDAKNALIKKQNTLLDEQAVTTAQQGYKAGAERENIDYQNYMEYEMNEFRRQDWYKDTIPGIKALQQDLGPTLNSANDVLKTIGMLKGLKKIPMKGKPSLNKTTTLTGKNKAGVTRSVKQYDYK